MIAELSHVAFAGVSRYNAVCVVLQRMDDSPG